MASTVQFVATPTTKLYAEATGAKAVTHLLWGDRVEITGGRGPRVRARARGRSGYIRPADLGDRSLLEVYIIDVGQGDGILVRLPDDRHLLIDGGYTRRKQQTGKSAADFVDWKFCKDYGRDEIRLDAVISSHCDADHYGGLWDLLDRSQDDELDARSVSVGTFFHAGVSWWTRNGRRSLGAKADGRLTTLLEGVQSIRHGLVPDAPLRLQGEWARFLASVLDAGCAVKRVSDRTGYLPGFEPKPGAATVRVLGPIEPEPGKLVDLGSDSHNTNGNSALLRVDYGRVRILLTGDLNRASQRHLIEHYRGRLAEFSCDVAKACHHGSDDVSYEFLELLSPQATVISSGDSEQHAHPRPSIVAAAGSTGHRTLDRDRLVTPLVYSTEISRSMRLGRIRAVDVRGHAGVTPGDVTATYAETNPGSLRPRIGRRRLTRANLVTGIVYGLVNVRTDGETVLCATLNERKNTWEVERFVSRF